jgi:hypothetical protein
MQYSETVDDYFTFGQINAVDTAKHALREAWIFYQTGYETLKPILLSLQRCEDATKRDYLKTGVFEPRYRSIERAGLLLNLFDEAGPIQSHDNIWQIFLSIQNRYDEWTEEAGDEYEEDEGPENLDLTTYVSIPSPMKLDVAHQVVGPSRPRSRNLPLGQRSSSIWILGTSIRRGRRHHPTQSWTHYRSRSDHRLCSTPVRCSAKSQPDLSSR